jgi:aminoglycoside phosphotransferase (APT) family kinase protein
MSTELMTTVLDEFKVSAEVAGAPLESRSGAGVHAVRTADGQRAFLKVSPTGPGLAAAQRELRFYREIAPLTPVRTPALLSHVESAAGIALLLEAAGETLPAAAWTADMWADLGRDLAALHTMPLPPGDDWSRPDALLDALAEPDLDQIRTFWSSELAALTGRRAELADQIAALPPAFTHGDCHTDNIVHSNGELVFCDWQVCGIGRPTTDLALLSVRATPAGVTVPAKLVDAYLDGRAGALRSGGPRSGGPQSGAFESGTLRSGGPQSGALESGNPQSGNPQSGNPQSGAPESGTLRSGGPQSADLQSADLQSADLQSALVAEELAIMVFLWPPYAAYNSPAGIARIRDRASELLWRWEA